MTAAETKKEKKPSVFWEKLKRFRKTPGGDLCVALVWVVLGLLIGLWLIGTCSDVMGIMKGDTQQEVTVKAGWSTFRMAVEMQKKGVINHPLVFTIYSDLKGGSTAFKSGTYLLDGSMSYNKIISTIQRKQSSQTVRITFTEGMNAYQIGGMLEENGVCLKTEFLNALNTGDFSNYDFIPNDAADSGRFYRLEGYLFPDTYDFYINENVNSVVRRFLNNFASKFTENMRAKAAEMGMSIDQVVTLASIIEKEATDVFEMANVSAVFHNRLENPRNYPNLQSDVTYFYVKSVINKILDVTDSSYTYAYDTYVRTGLPVGAICNPGINSLTAALNPSESNYYYFVTDKEGNFYYAETLSQHNSNIRKASKVGDIGGTYTHD